MASDGPILVTGAAGAIGAWVAANLLERSRDFVVFDLSDDRRRLRLILDEDRVASVKWLTGDIADSAAVERAVADTGASAIIHLAALQVPFVKADPVLGARVNVLGHLNVFEAARRHGVRRLVYASSVAALPLEGQPYPSTLYGVTKLAGEGFARVYADDWGVPSIGLRPHTVYGPTRDQGLTSAPTTAMLAAAAGRPYQIPFVGALSFQYAGEVADIFIRCAETDIDPKDTRVFDIATPPVTVEEIVASIRRVLPEAEIAAAGPPLPFPAKGDQAILRRLVGEWPQTPLEDGVKRTIDAFKGLLKRGLLSVDRL